ncbi:MAG: histidinol dehydrogenase [Chloroflexi bacterium]|nr:histidinol dehydrogenase [Chloroflexota bacterium]
MLRIVSDLQEARRGLLRRVPLELQEIPPALKQRIRESFGEELTPWEVVERIVSGVRHRGDAALLEYSRLLDGVELTSLEVGKEEIARSYDDVSSELVSALELAAERIRAFHQRQRRESWIRLGEGGLGQRVQPLNRVGIYVPGGTASYPSTVLMAAIPARVAGVREIVVTTPSPRGGTSAATLVAAHIAKVDRVFRIGGAQAIAALGLGTQSVPQVDKICGPGNIFVQLAKKMVYGTVDIDGLYGPTELMIVADDTADPALCAADLLAQAEHDSLASPILITDSTELAIRVQQEVDGQLVKLQRREIAAASLKAMGGIILVSNMQEAIDLVNDYAPEHLSLMLRDGWRHLDGIRNAGAVFVNPDSPEVLGDYVAGPSHVLPTGGTARFGSPLTTDDFFKVTSVIALDRVTLKTIGPSAAIIARSEGFDGHARAVEIRLAGS